MPSETGKRHRDHSSEWKPGVQKKSYMELAIQNHETPSSLRVSFIAGEDFSEKNETSDSKELPET